MDEELVFKSDTVVISKTLAQFGGVTYPINGIGSVRIDAPKRENWYLSGAALILVGLFGLGGDGSWGLLCILGGAAAIAVGYKFLPEKLMLRTASGDVQAYESVNIDEVKDIKEAIERAVVMRG